MWNSNPGEYQTSYQGSENITDRNEEVITIVKKFVLVKLL